MNNKVYIIILSILLAIIIACLFIIPLTSSKYMETINNEFTLNVSEPKYTIKFNANGGINSMTPQTFIYSVPQQLKPNAFVKTGFSFEKWTTNPDGTGDSYTDQQLVEKLSKVDGAEINLYAKWINAVARIGNNVYSKLQDAINAVPADNTETTIELLTNVNENISIAQNKNITFNLNNYTISASNNSVVLNSGTVRMSNGTILSTASNQSAFDNSATGKLYISGGSIKMTNSNGKQAIYNNGGIVEISGTAFLSSASNQTNLSNRRAAVHNLNNGTLTILGGTIISEGYYGVKNDAGTFIIGVKDANPDRTSPTIQGGMNGVNSAVNYKYYNGTIKGKDAAVNNEALIVDKEEGYSLYHFSESINGIVYQSVFLSNSDTTKVVTFDPNGGTLNESTRLVEENNPVGTLPIPVQNNLTFLGWFTSLTGGNEIDSNTIITTDITFYAHWSGVAEINGTHYSTLKDAIAAVPNNSQTIIKLLDDTSITEKMAIGANKNIVLDLQNHTITTTGNLVGLENSGTLEVTNGTITSSAGQATINNNQNALLRIRSCNVIATGDRQAIYNEKGIVEISGNSVLSSRATGNSMNSNVGRATIQNLNNSTVIITDGTIIGELQEAISNQGTLVLGTSDGNIDSTVPNIRGETSGIVNLGTLEFYDGIVKGITNSISGTITSQELNSQIVNGTEIIDGKTYNTLNLE